MLTYLGLILNVDVEILWQYMILCLYVYSINIVYRNCGHRKLRINNYHFCRNRFYFCEVGRCYMNML